MLSTLQVKMNIMTRNSNLKLKYDQEKTGETVFISIIYRDTNKITMLNYKMKNYMDIQIKTNKVLIYNYM